MIQLESMVELLPVSVFVKDAATLRFTLVNQALENLTGLSRDQLVGFTYEEFEGFDPALARLFTDAERRIANGELPRVSHSHVLPLGTGRHIVRGTTIPIRDESGRVTHLLGVLEDLTEEIDARRALQKEKHRAEAASRAKSEFMANISHELRTPLNVIIGYSEMLDDLARAAGRDQDSADLQRIVEAGRRLQHLIDEVLELARLNDDAGETTHAPLNVERLMSDLRGVAEPRAQATGNTLSIRGRHTGECVSDEGKVRRVLANLLDNAAKFTRDGVIMLEFDVNETGARFLVQDTGIGIAGDALARIFEPFVQADASESRAFGGTGLGLALCRRFCEQLRGDIQVASAPGRGSRFEVTIPNLAPPVERVAKAG